MDDGRGNYSTLEVATDSHKEVAPDNGPQVVQPPAHEYYKPGTTPQGSYYTGNDKFYHEQPPPHAYQKPDYPPQQAFATDGEKQPGKRICGLAAKTFYIVAAIVALLVIGAVVGGAVGGTVAKNNSSGQGSGSTVPSNNGTGTSPNQSVLNKVSRVSAVNWKDSNGASHQAVFSQDASNALLVSVFDSVNQTWTSFNVSERLARAGNPIDVKPGTSLAGAATGYPWPFQMNLYYQTGSGSLGEVFCKDPTGQTWGVGDLVKQAKKAADNTQIAAYWHRCGDNVCSGDILVAYEDPQNTLVFLNGSNWANSQRLISGLDPASGLALIPLVLNGGRKSLQPVCHSPVQIAG
jgi:hypothetical protein